MPLPPDIDTSAHRLLWAHLGHAAASRNQHLSQFDGLMLHLTLPDRLIFEHSCPLLDDLVEFDLIQAWGELTPGHRVLPGGNPDGKHRVCVLLTYRHLPAFLQKQGGGEGPDAPDPPSGA